MNASQTQPEAHAPNLDLVADGDIATDLECRACRYNLRGLAADARCPECNTSIADSLRSDRVHFAPDEWLRRLHWALRLACGGVFLVGLTAAALVMLLHVPQRIWAFLHFTVWTLLTVSVFITPTTGPNGRRSSASHWLTLSALLLCACASYWALLLLLDLPSGPVLAWNAAGQFLVPNSKAWAQVSLAKGLMFAALASVVIWALHLRAISKVAGWKGLGALLIGSVGLWALVHLGTLASDVVGFALARAAVAANPAAPDFSGPLQVVGQFEEALNALSVLVALAGAACLAVLARRIARIRYALQPANQ